jgi:hypothetical protein
MKNFFLIFSIIILAGCVAGKKHAPQKYPAKQLYADFDLFRQIMQESHPGLTWYTPGDSIDMYFNRSRNMIRDSMSAPEFRLVLSYAISSIRCGHTAARLPKNYPANDSVFFPLQLKIWPDTAIITQNISRKDSMVRRGSLLYSIDGMPIEKIVDTLFRYLSTDGYNVTHKYQTLSNRGVFGSLYMSLFGMKPTYTVGIEDSTGHRFETVLHTYRDTTRRPQRPPPHVSRREKKEQQKLSLRRFYIDSISHAGVIELNTFTKNAKLRKFFRQTFRTIRKEQIDNVVIDLRSNGGGTVTYSNLLTKYLANAPFKIADSLYAIRRFSKYRDYQQSSLLNSLFLIFMTRKLSDGNYHFRYFENRYFHPKTSKHYSGNVYILSGGNTYSASTLVIQSLKGQENVTIVGEETGGGQYGNNAWLIPEVTLPDTKMRFRLPLFRLVIDKDLPKGFGVPVEIQALPTAEAIRKNRDFKMDAVRELIRKKG